VSADTVPGQLEEIRAELLAGARRMDGIERQLEQNTVITLQVKDLLDVQNTARLGFKAAWGIGKFIAWAGGIAAGLLAFWALFHQGPKP